MRTRVPWALAALLTLAACDGGGSESAPDTADSASCEHFMGFETFYASWRVEACDFFMSCDAELFSSREECEAYADDQIADVRAGEECVDECRTYDALVAAQSLGECGDDSSQILDAGAGIPHCDE